MGRVRRAVRFLKAMFRLDLGLVCEVAAEGKWDFHDYHDTAHKTPDHFVPLACERCGKEFWL